MKSRFWNLIRMMAAGLGICLLIGCTGGMRTIRVSVESDALEGNGSSAETSMSGNARFVAFSSNAGNLVPSDTNGVSDIFVKDTLTGLTTRVSVDSADNQANAESYTPCRWKLRCDY